MFSYVDLVRTEIALAAGEQFGATIPEEEMDAWRSLGDVSRSVVAHAAGAVNESEVFDWTCILIAEGYGVAAPLAVEEEVFDDYGRMTRWFMAPPYPHRLGDRWFARQRGG